MNLIYQRVAERPDGIFSNVLDENGAQVMVVLEHAYRHADNTYHAIVQPGVYTCVRGLHRLHNMTEDFETFEITGVQGHGGILFHWGNWNDDSEGCSLCGESMYLAFNPHHANHQEKMVTSSRATFAKFMQLQSGLDQFQLTVNGMQSS